jgi:hypothetical protein
LGGIEGEEDEMHFVLVGDDGGTTVVVAVVMGFDTRFTSN